MPDVDSQNVMGSGSDQYNGGLVRWVTPEGDSEAKSAVAFLKNVKEAGLKRWVGRDEDTYWRSRHVVKPEFIAASAGATPDVLSIEEERAGIRARQ